MAYEISQFDIQNRQKLANEVKHKGVPVMDIGEAKVTRTIFGRPRVRVICQRDKKRRAWMLSVLAAILVSGAGWQGWVALQRALNAPPPLPLSARIKISPPVIESEDFTPEKRRQKTQMQMLLEGMATHRPPEPPEPQQAPVTTPGNVPGKIAANPAKAQGVNKHKAPLAANGAGVQTDMPQSASPAAPAQPAVPALVPPSAAQPAASKPASAAPEKPASAAGSAALTPAAGGQPPVPAQP
jgi:hypothetical protein